MERKEQEGILREKLKKQKVFKISCQACQKIKFREVWVQ